ncbi:outer membrane beta-barrel protein [Phenylobacterium sp.]|uniref:outer membrane beta-barrel protein n=1 Tax=Phenylobacterium sp. TaxID=1871053 RepID=UPI0030F42056
MTANKRVLFATVAVVLAAGASTNALAQTRGFIARGQAAEASNFARDRNISVRARSHPGYEALGVPMGAFTAYPKVAVGPEYNDNIYGASTNEVDDVVWRVQPEVVVVSDWSRHSLQGYARSVINRYNDFDSENTSDYTVGANGRLDITRRASISAGAEYASLSEARTSSSSPVLAANPIEFDKTTGFVVAGREFNRLKVSARVDYSKFDYQDGRTTTGFNVEQDDRDRTNTSLTARADYAVSPATAIFLEVAGNKRDYRLAKPAVVLIRDSDGVQALAGANFELGAVMRGEVGVGYLRQSYDDPAFKDITGMGARAQVEWFPTDMTTVSVNGSRSVEDSGILGSSGYLSSNFGGQIDHELMRNVLVSGQLSYGKDEYEGVDRNDKRLNAGVSATYLMNRHVGLTVGYSYFDQKSDGLAAGGDFKVNKVGANVTLQF